jgi:hypothetical protein
VTSVGGVIVAVDPGREKCGVAVLAGDGEVLARQVVAVGELAGCIRMVCGERDVRAVVVGTGTGHAAVKSALMGALSGKTVEIVDVPEFGTTLAARKLYYRYNPARGWRRLLPVGLRVPSEPLDGYAAEAIGRRYVGLDRAPR